MSHILTLVAHRGAAPAPPAPIARVRDASQGGAPDILSPGEAADIAAPRRPTWRAVARRWTARRSTPSPRPPPAAASALLVADMDSTIVTVETLDELADFAGLKDADRRDHRARAMNGELDFKAALRERVAMLKGLPVDALEQTWQRVRLTPGARELVATMRAHGALLARWCPAASPSSPAASPPGRLRRAPLQHAAGRRRDAHRPGRRADPRPRRQAGHADAARRRARPADVGDAGGRRRRQRPRHDRAPPGWASRSTPSRSSQREARARVDHADLRALLFAQGYRRRGDRQPLMSTSFGRYGPTHPLLGALSRADQPPAVDARMRHAMGSMHRTARSRANVARLSRKNSAAASAVYLAGIGPAGHNSGVALVEVSRDRRRTPDLQQRGGALQRDPPLHHFPEQSFACPAGDDGQARHRSGADPCVRRELGLHHARRDVAAQHRRGTACQPRLPRSGEFRADERASHRARIQGTEPAWAGNSALAMQCRSSACGTIAITRISPTRCRRSPAATSR